ncbi:squalene--hopene cyclase [Rubellicoccus peritrichatus]|uniref:Squalene--hopene cyclase n=1 Tax=Rubellicoccus peritrichatus TaxID=3080537 RepID=A0AAQ3L6N2_9BACT|nr:squalene--hopene cyclase [Puniceicoccus sp. CR14]WOO39981.1 squalene--hopene cyclase [Puniceicoccus sp. CR14]
MLDETVSNNSSAVDDSIRKAQDFLFSIQHEDGYWNCELPIDSTVACDYLLYFFWTGEADAIPVDRIADFVRGRQLEDGGWPQFPGGPSELNATVKGYHALKMAGDSPNAEHMQRARTKALELGGIPAMHTWGKLYLAMVGCFPWKFCPLIPVELLMLPKWFPVHIYRMSSWTRNMLVPLSVINHFKPVREIPSCPDLNELYPEGTMEGNWSLKWSEKTFSAKNVFLVLDKLGRFVNHIPEGITRKRGLKIAEQWICDRVGQGSDGMGAIFPAIMNVLIAFELLGYKKDHWLFKKNRRHFEELTMFDRVQPVFLSNDQTDYYEKGEKTEPGWRVGPCFSPVWDTALITMALGESGIGKDDARMTRAGDWLLDREIGLRGDWKENCDFPEATGWAFEFNNDWYPDVDDTFQVLLGLNETGASDEDRHSACLDRGMRWCRAMQCKEGGFAAFDKDVTDWWLEAVPFADHNAILDPPCSDITGRALETLAMAGYDTEDDVVRRARQFLVDTQEQDGSWFGRWGVNYIYGTSHAIRGLKAIGEDMTQVWLQKSRNFLENNQNADGGWGESCWSYHDDSTRAQGESTASQTAWALLGLLCYGDPERASIRRAVNYLLEKQLEDGSWRYDEFTGTGFPRIFYLKYTSYQWYLPLYALAKYRKLCDKQ